MGTPDFAVPCLSLQHQSEIDVVSVITAPDRPSGRGRKLQASAVKQYALDNNIKVLQPIKLKDPLFLEELESLQADLFIVVAFRMLPKLVWDMPKNGTINLHASLLPNYRGAAPINWAIINGESKTGLSTFFINEDIDTGSIIDQLEIEIKNEDNMGGLHDKMSAAGSELLLKTVRNISDGNIKPIKQNHQDIHKDAPKLNAENTKIDFGQNAENVHNLIRGLSPYPGAFSFLEQNEESLKVKIFESSFDPEKTFKMAGSIQCNDRDELLISCGKGHIRVLELQIPGKKRMKTKDLLNGFKLNNDAQFH